MRKGIFILIALSICVCSTLDAQITELKYLMKYNCETNNYDVKIKIMEGSANTVLERVQFNSQLTILVPTGLDFEIVDRYQPLENNQTYQGTVPNQWETLTPVISPEGHDKYDFYSVAPMLAPASFFNDIEEGEEVTIFSFAVSGDEEYDERIRFFENDIDVHLSFFEGADLRNGYSVGGAANKYNGNIHQNCIVSNLESTKDSEISIYPNPTNSKIFIEVSENIKSIKMINSLGSKIKELNKPNVGRYAIDVDNINPGIYFLITDTGAKVRTQQIIIY